MSRAIPILNGLIFTQDVKQALVQILRQAFVDRSILIPYDPDLIEELHIEQFQLTKTGKYIFSHPEGTPDDRFWSVAMAVAAAHERPRRAIIEGVRR